MGRSATASAFPNTLLGMIIVVVTAGAVQADVWHVRADAAGGGDGTSWATAMKRLQPALAAGEPGDEVWVAGGVYRPTARTEPADPRTATFWLGSGVGVFGGFAGTETQRSQRDPAANETILCGDLDDNDVPFAGADRLRFEPTRAENAYHVVTVRSLDLASLLDGFVITRGHATGSGDMRGDGGGIFLREAELAVVDCTFRHNAAGQGGAIRDIWSRLTVERCTFQGNSASGSGLFSDRSEALVLSSTFVGNTSNAISVIGPGVASIVGCLVVGNPIRIGYQVQATVLNSTFTGSGRFGIVIGSRGAATIKNSVIWPNLTDAMPADVRAIQTFGSGTVTVEYSCVQGGGPDGVANIDLYPRFVHDPDDGGDGWGVGDNDDPGDVRLRCGSPCLDAGDTDAVPPQLVADLDGRPRIVGGVVDLGAFEGPQQGLIVSAAELDVPEGGTAALTVALACDPEGLLVVTATKERGDPDLTIQSGETLVFDSTNFSIPQVVTLAAADDADPFQGDATLVVRTPGVPDARVELREDEDDVVPILHVDGRATDGGIGTSWPDAFPRLEDALRVANESFDIVREVWVATGTYTPAGPGGDRNATFPLAPEVGVYGGFAGTETGREQRDAVAHVTILSGDLDRNDAQVDNPDDLLAEPTRGDNSYHVVTARGVGVVTAILDGFMIVGGHADGDGGGLSHRDTVLDVRNCIFRDNAARRGGAVATGCSSSNCMTTVRLTDCVFQGNVARDYGGAVKSGGRDEGMTLRRCVFRGNRSPQGRDLFVSGQAVVDACTFLSDAPDASGDAVHLEGGADFRDCLFRDYRDDWAISTSSGYGSAGLVSNCDFINNGGALGNVGCPTILDCRFHGNGTGIFMEMGCPLVVNCEFVGNIRGASSRGHSTPVFVNCTFAGNTSYPTWDNMSSWSTLINCIVWGNGEPPFGDGFLPQLSYTCIEGGWDGEGNVDADPRFVRAPSDGGDGWRDDPATPNIDEGANDDFGDLRLRAGSPCIDAGDSDVDLDPYDFGRIDRIPDTDLDGLPRFVDDPATPDTGLGTPPIVDMGAYEFRCASDTPPADPSEDCNANGVSDACDLAFGTATDCNANGLPDDCDIAAGRSQDRNDDGVPDECQLHPADFDRDGDIDLADLLFLQSCFSNSDGPVTGACRDADLDGDGDVDLADVLVFQAAFTGAG